jgi:mannose-6-phosphate isomerase class I
MDRELRAPAILVSEPGPRTLVEKRWAGARLGALRGSPDRPIGESWEFSTLPGAESRALGRPLHELLGRRLAILAKLIETRLPLSIQVHPPADPDGEWNGKEEAWVVLHAEPGSAVHAGLAAGIDRSELARRVRDGEPEAVLAALQRIPVEAGSAVLLPSGTVHAVGAGILLAEIQQPADLTLRLFDWGSPRALQVEDALAAIDPCAQVRVGGPRAGATLRGQHLELRSFGPGSHTLELASDALVVAVLGECALRAADASARLATGDLRLFTGGRLVLEISGSGMAAVGRALG